MDQVEQVPVLVAVGVLPGLEGQRAVVEGNATEVLGVRVVGVEAAAVGALPAPLVGPFCCGDVAGIEKEGLGLMFVHYKMSPID